MVMMKHRRTKYETANFYAQIESILYSHDLYMVDMQWTSQSYPFYYDVEPSAFGHIVTMYAHNAIAQ